jgi:hypothetical protein
MRQNLFGLYFFLLVFTVFILTFDFLPKFGNTRTEYPQFAVTLWKTLLYESGDEKHRTCVDE